jgi:hypothetical protein
MVLLMVWIVLQEALEKMKAEGATGGPAAEEGGEKKKKKKDKVRTM